MGNSISYELEDDDDMLELEEIDDDIEDQELIESGEQLRGQIGNVIGNVLHQIVENLQRSSPDMPVIRKKPDLSIFRHTSLYKEIKAMCGLPANSKRPNERWSLTRGLMKREMGIGGYPPGSFTANQHRRIANLFVPNQKEERLMSLEAKIFVSKFNKDGSRLITACQKHYVRIFDASKGTYHRINRIKAKDVNWSILDIDFSPCGRFFAYSTWSNYFFVVPIDGTEDDFVWHELNTDQPRCGIFSIRFSPCGTKIIGGCNNSCVYICDRESQSRKYIPTQYDFHVDINAVSYISDTDVNVFASGCNNGVIKLWDTRCLGSRRKTPVGVFMGHWDGITYIDPRNDGKYILSNSKDQSIKIWDLRKMTPDNKISKKPFFPMISWDYRWDPVPREYYNRTSPLDGDASVMTYRGHRVAKSLLRAKFSPAFQTGQRYIYTGCGTGRIIIYDVLTGTIKEAIEGHKDIVRDLSWHPIRSEIISSSWDSHVNLNTFKRNPLLKRSSSEPIQGPLRRSRRIAHQNGELDEDDEDEGTVNRW